MTYVIPWVFYGLGIEYLFHIMVYYKGEQDPVLIVRAFTLDPQTAEVRRGLRAMGYEQAGSHRWGKFPHNLGLTAKIWGLGMP